MINTPNIFTYTGSRLVDEVYPKNNWATYRMMYEISMPNGTHPVCKHFQSPFEQQQVYLGAKPD